MVAVTCDFRVQSQCQDFCQGSQRSVKIFSRSMGVLRGGLYVVSSGRSVLSLRLCHGTNAALAGVAAWPFDNHRCDWIMKG